MHMTTPTSHAWTSLGLLILRVSTAGMMFFGHGLPKILDFSARSAAFPDPLGLGNNVSLALAIFGEAVCSILIALGLFTRLAATPFLITMLTAAFLVHSADPWAKKEFALLYAAPALTLIFTGAGAFSIDGWRQRHR
jgi:putative oxidoreductase